MTKRTTTSLLVIGLAATQLGANDCGSVISDPGFDLWCGDQLCSWKIDHGDVAKVPTWHEGDDGVELLGSDAAIYQLSPVDYMDGGCIEFELIADVAAGVDLRFQADINSDGSIELDQPIPEASWRPISYRFSMRRPFSGARFWIVKRSGGRAVVAQLAANLCGEGGAGTIIDPGPAPNGARCDSGDDCVGGVCAGFPMGSTEPRCGACGTCGTGEVCGLSVPAEYTLQPYRDCVPDGGKTLGALCGVNEECASDLCFFGVCSACWASSCAGGQACEPALAIPIGEGPFNYPAPFVCAPGAGLGIAGEPCGTGADCASGVCDGTERNICPDGRSCAGDADCPVASGLQHGACVTVGVLGGTCR